MAPNAKQMQSYRETLLDMRRRINGQVDHVVASINAESNVNENLSGTPLHIADIAQPGVMADVHVLDRENVLLQQIDEALARIGEGTYGSCSVCGEDIKAERLQALPFATTCTQCAQNEEPG